VKKAVARVGTVQTVSRQPSERTLAMATVATAVVVTKATKRHGRVGTALRRNGRFWPEADFSLPGEKRSNRRCPGARASAGVSGWLADVCFRPKADSVLSAHHSGKRAPAIARRWAQAGGLVNLRRRGLGKRSELFATHFNDGCRSVAGPFGH
jgi:hypothetical protein